MRTVRLTRAGLDERAGLLTASMIRIAAADPRHPDARVCLRSYFTELSSRFEGGFDPSLSILADDEDLTPPTGVLLVATLREEPVGCGALKYRVGAPAEVKRMWVSPAVRTLRLETNRALTEAIGLYRSAGYREVSAFNAEPYAHHWFEKAIG